MPSSVFILLEEIHRGSSSLSGVRAIAAYENLKIAQDAMKAMTHFYCDRYEDVVYFDKTSTHIQAEFKKPYSEADWGVLGVEYLIEERPFIRTEDMFDTRPGKMILQQEE